MKNHKNYSDILSGKLHLSPYLAPYPMEMLKRVDKPTTRITDNIERFDEREMGFAKAIRGDYKDWKLKKGPPLMLAKDPLLSLYNVMLWNLPPVDSGVRREVPPFLFAADKSKLMPPPEELTSAEQIFLEVSPEKAKLPDDVSVMSRNIKSVGYFLGASVMGICELPQWVLYSHRMDGEPVVNKHKYAICIAADMNYWANKGTTGYDWFGGSGPMWSYLSSGFIATMLAAYIRKLGYPARVHHYHNYQLPVTPLLVLSGIGELSRTGLALNPFIGLRYKAAVVTTDLPLEPDKPIDFGLQDFCRKCKKCAKHCPSQSISFEDTVMHNGYERWDFNPERCTKMRMTNPKGAGCGACVHVCPWNKPKGWIHDQVRWMVAHTPFMNDFLIKMDDVFGYGKTDIKYRWQLEL